MRAERASVNFIATSVSTGNTRISFADEPQEHRCMALSTGSDAFRDWGGRWSSLPAEPKSGQRVIAHRRIHGELDQVACCSLSEEIDLLDKGRGEAPLFVSYFTKDTPYEALANQLRDSLDRFDLPHRIEPIESLGSWVANTGLKSRFIEKTWNESDGPICWVDADAEILRTPSFVFGNPFDIAMVRRHGWYDLAGFVYLNKSDAAGCLVREWSRLCEENPTVWDQVLLTLAWYRTARDGDLSSLFLNDGIFRFPRPRMRDARDKLLYYPTKKKIRPFIDQKQASRQLKAFVNASQDKVNERGSDDIGEKFKSALSKFDFEHDMDVDAIFKSI